MPERSDRPPQRYLSAEYVLSEMCDFGEHRFVQLLSGVLRRTRVMRDCPYESNKLFSTVTTVL